ncbi:EAL domain-containing protein [Dyella sp. KRB-257]|uniref:EAL domain-containing protein n=1 Tax=Dyella sp. KRB-257 TaxID=3400915 RepID=UPI003C0ECFEB
MLSKGLAFLLLGWCGVSVVLAENGPMAPAATASAAPASAAAVPTHIRVVTDNNYPPFLFIDADGQPRGMEVDRWRLFEQRTGIQVDLVPMQWVDAQRELLGGRADVVDMIFRTPEREALYDFSAPYATLPVGIYVDRRILGVRDVASLRGFPVAVQRGDACVEKLRSLGVSNLQLFADYNELLQAARQRDSRIFCMDEYPANFYLYRNDALSQFHEAFPLYTGQFRFAVRKGNAAMLSLVERGMAEITPAELAAMRARWLGKPSVLRQYLTPIVIGVVLALAALALLGFRVWVLRSAVARRTRELFAGRRRLRAVFDASPDAMWVSGGNGKLLERNERAESALGLGRKGLPGRTARDLSAADFADRLEALDRQILATGQPCAAVLPLEADDGTQRQYEVIKVPMPDPDGKATGVLSVARDITERLRVEGELRLAAVAFQTQEALMVTSATGVIQRVNEAFGALTGYAPQEVLGKTPALLGTPRHDHDHEHEHYYRQLWEQVRAEGFWQGEQWVTTRAGVPKVVRTTISSVRDGGGQVSHHVCTMTDLTGEREAHARAERMTFFDPLTDLPNRHYLHGQIQHLLDGGRGGVLLTIDLDHFKRVNDLRGHMAGDRLLWLVAMRLRPLLDEHGVLSRFSGDTFALLAACPPSEPGDPMAQAMAVAERVHAALRPPFELDDEARVTMTCSIGVAEVVPGQGTAASVFKQAEMAMYAAKRAGRDRSMRFAPAMMADVERNEVIAEALHQAIATDALELHLQLQVDRSGRATGAEALVRWQRPDGESVSPAVFIPIAEERGQILALGRWMLRRACLLLVAWAGAARTCDLVLAVNVSAHQFAHPDFVDSVLTVLAETGANPARLELEITETALVSDLASVASTLASLRRLGVRVSLDDFGTGYSSLAYLSRLPLDQLKIDQSFVSRLPEVTGDATVAQTIIAMGHGLGLQVIAEGVETEAQRSFLMEHGCDAFQGYLLGRPMPPAQFESLLAGLQPG